MTSYLPWLISASALVGMVMVGRLLWQGWVVLLGSEMLFLALAGHERLWGLIPLSAALLVTYARNTASWRRAAS